VIQAKASRWQWKTGAVVAVEWAREKPCEAESSRRRIVHR